MSGIDQFLILASEDQYTLLHAPLLCLQKPSWHTAAQRSPLYLPRF
jgi:hypothetical protein